MRILLISPYDAMSHRQWREGLVQRIEADWEVITLPARNWAWRTGVHTLQLTTQFRDILLRDWDWVVATSVLDLPVLRGLMPKLQKVPTIIYWHENQVAYPGEISPYLLLKELHTALVAEVNVFNSQYNLTSLRDGVEQFLEKKPDRLDTTMFHESLDRAHVIPVGIDDVWFSQVEKHRGRIVWNHRWEWDKAPETFFGALRILQDRDIDFRLCVHGQKFRSYPEVFDTVKRDFESHLDGFGYVDRQTYIQNVKTSSIIASSALHEFQGLAVLEGMASGLRPVVPDRLAYPGYVNHEDRYSGEDEKLAMADALTNALAQPNCSYDLGEFRWSAVAESWQKLLVA